MNGDNDLKFGDRVRISHRLERSVRYPAGKPVRKHWAPVAMEGEGIFIGKRTLSNGIISFTDMTTYEPKEHFPAALVALEKRNPVYVLFDAVERVEAANA